jgi:Sodium / potassium ATPase beta chain
MIFYSCLAGLALSCMYVFMHFIIETSVGPRWQLEESIIGDNPGLKIENKKTFPVVLKTNSFRFGVPAAESQLASRPHAHRGQHPTRHPPPVRPSA